MSYKDLSTLAKKVLRAENVKPGGQAPVSFNVNGVELYYDAAQDVLRDEMKKFVGYGNYYDMEEQLPKLYRLISESIDDVLPRNVDAAIGQWAEVKNLRQNEKAIFTRRLGVQRAKHTFITRVGLSATYDVFRLDTKEFEVPTNAYGGAAQIGFEEYLDGRVDYSELTRIVLEGIENSIFKEVRHALEKTAALMTPNTNNKAVVNGFNYDALNNLITTARSYGGNVQILATQALASKFTNHPSFTSDADRADMRNDGYIGKIGGANVVLLPNAYEDETNTNRVYQDRYAYILPTDGPDSKIVKVALEGQTIVKQWENRDNSRELQAYKKLGVALVADAPQVSVYEDTSIPYVKHRY